MTFKEKVQEILDKDVCNFEFCKNYQTHKMVAGDYVGMVSDCKSCQRDRILAAYREAVEGMPLKTTCGTLTAFAKGYKEGAKTNYAACKEHMLKEAK